MKLIERLAELGESQERGLLFTVVEGDSVGSKLLVLESGERIGEGPEEAVGHFDELIGAGATHSWRWRTARRSSSSGIVPPPRLFVYGAVDTAEALCRSAKLLGWKVIVADARAKFATEERIPSADELIVAWPDDALRRCNRITRPRSWC